MFEVPFWARVDSIDGRKVLLRARYKSADSCDAGDPHIALVDAEEADVVVVEPKFRYRLISGEEVVTNEPHAV